MVRERISDGLELQRVTCAAYREWRPVVVLMGGRHVVPPDGVLHARANPGARWRVVAWVAGESDGAA